MKALAKYFFRGLLIVVPIAASLYIVWVLFVRIDSLIAVPELGGRHIPGLGFAVTLLAITAVGWLGSNLVTRGLVRNLESLFSRLPLVKLLYSSIRDLIGAFVGDRKSFDQPVLVRLNHDEPARVLGFVTRSDLAFLGLSGHVAVYFPQSYNFAGNLVVLSRDAVETISCDSAELMTFVVSGGVSGFKAEAEHPNRARVPQSPSAPH